jgi:hypothetical protein
VVVETAVQAASLVAATQQLDAPCERVAGVQSARARAITVR